MRTLLFLVALSGLTADAAELRAGAAKVVITPPAGAPMAGYYYNRGADGVHDDLHAKAIVLDAGGEKAALVACDLAALPRDIAVEARKLIQQNSGIAPDRVMISATHTHTGPVLVTGGTRYNLTGQMRDIALQYAADLPRKIAEAVRLADAALKPARVRAGVGHEDALVFNRRFHMKDGSVGWNPGKMNPNIVRPAGPVDPDVAVVSIEAADGKAIATYVNYALHLDTVGGQEYSADFPYTLDRLLSEVRGRDSVTVFTIGCAGNVNHIDVSTREPQKGHGEAARIGTILAAEVIQTLRRASGGEIQALRTRSEVITLPLAPVAESEIAPARATASRFGQPNAAPFLELVRAAKIVDIAERKGKPLEAEVQVIALGDQIAWVALPGEIFTELGMAIKRNSPFPHTIIAELANGSVGYVPDRKAYPQGAYEVVSARGAAGSGEMLVDAASRMLIELFDAARPR
jgi:hypothetical protein